jgi:hypothetical protein
MKRFTSIYVLAAIFAVSSPAAESPPDELVTAKAELSQLLSRYTIKHPVVQAKMQEIAELETLVAARQEESAELRLARVQLAELRLRYDAQLAKVEQMERQERQQDRQGPDESAELQAARARLAEVGRVYRSRHPRYQEALRAVEELERQQAGGNEPGEEAGAEVPAGQSDLESGGGDARGRQ